MVYLCAYSFIVCVIIGMIRIDVFNIRPKQDKIAYNDGVACIMLSVVVLANFALFCLSMEISPFWLFVSGAIALVITFKRGNLFAEILSGLITLLSLLFAIIPIK